LKSHDQQWLSQRTGKFYRLPTDAECKYGTRGRSEASRFPWGDALDPACFGGEVAPRPAGFYAPNALGLYDMICNVWCWCSERYEDVSQEIPAVNKPTGKDTTENRVLRSGSYMTMNLLNLWITYRHEDPPDFRHRSIGSRIAM